MVYISVAWWHWNVWGLWIIMRYYIKHYKSHVFMYIYFRSFQNEHVFGIWYFKKNQNFIMKKGGYKTQLCFPENPWLHCSSSWSGWGRKCDSWDVDEMWNRKGIFETDKALNYKIFKKLYVYLPLII